MKAFLSLLVLAGVLGAPGCRSLSYIPVSELTDDEREELNSAAGLPVVGYRSDRGTIFRDSAIARSRSSQIEFAPVKKTDLFEHPVLVGRGRIDGVGRPKFDLGMTLTGIVLIPILIIPAIVTGGKALGNYMNVVTLGGMK